MQVPLTISDFLDRAALVHPDHIAVVDEAVGDWLVAEQVTLGLRSVYFPISEATYLVPLVLSVAIGGLLHADGLIGLGALIGRECKQLVA